MNAIYDICWKIIFWGLKTINKCHLIKRGSKLQLFICGQKDIFTRIETLLNGNHTKPILWVHASSLGEYNVASPIIKQIKAYNKYKIFLTFFSSTGIEVLGKKHSDVDFVEYLPIDTRANAKRMIKTIRPVKAIFIISEFWPNYLYELKQNNIPTILLSGLIKAESPAFKFYGGLIRRSLNCFTEFMVLNEESKNNLATIGIHNVMIIGDPLFDNAVTNSQTSYTNKIIESFVSHGNIFIAGSISDKKDLKLVSHLANKHRDIRFLIVPHEISEEKLNETRAQFKGETLCYHECDENIDFANTQILIIDFLGALPYLYRYAKWAYVGGGFTPYLHSVIEATVYGIPVAFGPQTKRKITPMQLIQLGIGCKVRNFREIDKWFTRLKNSPEKLDRIKNQANKYVKHNIGASEKIVSFIIK